ncbi:hypothetical protein [Rhodovulum sp. YEN HP10]|uniref:hypothetical protein n=1 Tax=Rhodovulum sp. HP10 TaxID=3387397 RepID=UPI0039DF9973
MLGFSVLVAGAFSFGSLIVNDIDPVALTALRFLLAGAVIGAAAAAVPRGLTLSGAGRDLRALFRADVRGAEDRGAGLDGGGDLAPGSRTGSYIRRS